MKFSEYICSLLRLIQASRKSYFGPLLISALLPLHCPATLRYHYTSERTENGQNTGGFVVPKGLESMSVSSFGQKAYACSEWKGADNGIGAMMLRMIQTGRKAIAVL